MGTLGPFTQVPPTVQASTGRPHLQHSMYASTSKGLDRQVYICNCCVERRRAMVPASQVLETARVRCDQWLQSTPDQRARLEPVYILGDRKLIPETVNANPLKLRSADHWPLTRYHSLDSEIIGDTWSNCKHVAACRPSSAFFRTTWQVA